MYIYTHIHCLYIHIHLYGNVNGKELCIIIIINNYNVSIKRILLKQSCFLQCDIRFVPLSIVNDYLVFP